MGRNVRRTSKYLPVTQGVLMIAQLALSRSRDGATHRVALRVLASRRMASARLVRRLRRAL